MHIYFLLTRVVEKLYKLATVTALLFGFDIYPCSTFGVRGKKEKLKAKANSGLLYLSLCFSVIILLMQVCVLNTGLGQTN